jgi:hypothetical protein
MHLKVTTEDNAKGKNVPIYKNTKNSLGENERKKVPQFKISLDPKTRSWFVYCR